MQTSHVQASGLKQSGVCPPTSYCGRGKLLLLCCPPVLDLWSNHSLLILLSASISALHQFDPQFWGFFNHLSKNKKWRDFCDGYTPSPGTEKITPLAFKSLYFKRLSANYLYLYNLIKKQLFRNALEGINSELGNSLENISNSHVYNEFNFFVENLILVHSFVKVLLVALLLEKY